MSESVLMSSQENQYQHSISLLHVSLLSPASSLHFSASLRSLAELRMGLRFPGQLGYWSPPPLGLGRTLGLLLPGQGEKKKKKDTFNFTLKEIRQSK